MKKKINIDTVAMENGYLEMADINLGMAQELFYIENEAETLQQ